MPRNAQKTRQRIIDAAYEMFYRHGFNRAGVDEVAAAAGITKRTLYAHFESKDSLLESVLRQRHELGIARTRQWADRQTEDLESAIDELFAELVKWSRGPGWTGSGFTRLAMELADMPGHPARRLAGQHKKAVEENLAALLGRFGLPDPRASAREIAMLLEGAILLILIHGDTAYAHQGAELAKRMLAGRNRPELPGPEPDR